MKGRLAKRPGGCAATASKMCLVLRLEQERAAADLRSGVAPSQDGDCRENSSHTIAFVVLWLCGLCRSLGQEMGVQQMVTSSENRMRREVPSTDLVGPCR